MHFNWMLGHTHKRIRTRSHAYPHWLALDEWFGHSVQSVIFTIWPRNCGPGVCVCVLSPKTLTKIFQCLNVRMLVHLIWPVCGDDMLDDALIWLYAWDCNSDVALCVTFYTTKPNTENANFIQIQNSPNHKDMQDERANKCPHPSSIQPKMNRF